MKSLQTIMIPRWYGFHRGQCQNVQLHVFCDASEIAYGAVAYFRAVIDGHVDVSFVISKTRLAPIKTLTIPRLELQGAVVASRLKSKISEEIDFEIDETHFWTDSKIVLHYLNNTQRRFSTYVSHRVAEIVSNSSLCEWHHIPGTVNDPNECLYCKRRRAKPTVPLMASLPKERLALCEPPFTHTGLDYFGPISVKRGRVTEKRWGCIFTCLTTRVVHLELAGDLTTDSFIMALRRFRGRRGNPKSIRSDNGSNFVGAERELAEALRLLNQEQIVSKLAQEGITWYFNPPSAPHMGGIFESMVKQVKRAMKTVINNNSH